MNVRKPAVAGAFYPETPEVVKREVEGCFRSEFGPGALPGRAENGPRKVIALVSPHAGYAFSGPVAAYGFSELARDGVPDLFIILGPNHRGLGAHIAVGATGYWETPIGRNDVAEDIARDIIAGSKLAEQDEWAHLLEHAVEVQLPFLNFLFGEGLRFVPIIMADHDLDAAVDLGGAMAEAIKGKNAVIIASTDFTHYQPHTVAEQNDALAMDAICHLDEIALRNVVRQRGISMCGVGPVMATIVAAKQLGATQGRLVRYITSGDITGNRDAVVGYGSLVITG